MKDFPSSWFVITADQVGSRTARDAVPLALETLGSASLGMRLDFERTVGDEIQGLTASVDDVLVAVKVLTRLGRWRIGVGVGPVEVPLAATSRAARGPAFIAARDAVAAAYRAPSEIALRAVAGASDAFPPDARASGVSGGLYARYCSAPERADSALTVWRALIRRRTDEGWQAVTLVESGVSHREAARRLGVSESAVSQRLARARLAESVAAERLAACELSDLLAAAPDALPPGSSR